MTEDVQLRIQGVLRDHHRKSHRVLARLIAECIPSPPAVPAEPIEDGHLVLQGKRPDPPTWLRYAETIPAGEAPVAVTRNRTVAAIEALGLDPTEVRAVVIEHDFIRVFRWADRTAAQTMPILKETA